MCPVKRKRENVLGQFGGHFAGTNKEAKLAVSVILPSSLYLAAHRAMWGNTCNVGWPELLLPNVINLSHETIKKRNSAHCP